MALIAAHLNAEVILVVTVRDGVSEIFPDNNRFCRVNKCVDEI